MARLKPFSCFSWSPIFYAKSDISFLIYDTRITQGKLEIPILIQNRGNQDFVILDKYILPKKWNLYSKFTDFSKMDNLDSIETFGYSGRENFDNKTIILKPHETFYDTLYFMKKVDSTMTYILNNVDDCGCDSLFEAHLVSVFTFLNNEGKVTRKPIDVGKIFYSIKEQKIICNLFLGKNEIYSRRNFNY